MIRLTKHTVCYNPDLKDKLISITTFFTNYFNEQFNFNNSNWYLFSNLKEFCEWFTEQEEQKCQNACIKPSKEDTSSTKTLEEKRKDWEKFISQVDESNKTLEKDYPEFINTRTRKYLLKDVIEYVNKIMTVSKLSGKELSYAMADLEEWLQEEIK